MDTIAPQENRVNKAIKWLKDHQTDIAIFCIVLFSVLLVIGILRLWTLIPLKEPIRIEEDVTTF